MVEKKVGLFFIIQGWIIYFFGWGFEISGLNKLKSYVEFYFHYIKMLDEFILINSKYKKKNIKTRIEQIKSTLKAFMIKNEKNKIILLKIIQLVLKDDKKILKKKLALNQINSINGFWG